MKLKDWIDYKINSDPFRILWQNPYLFYSILSFVFYISRKFLTVAFSFNQFTGIIVSLIIAVIVFLLFDFLNKRTIGKFPLSIVFASFIIIILLGSSLFGAISYSLFQANIAVYEPHEEINIEKLGNFYIWYFIDMIPGIDIWKILNVKSPVQIQGTWAGVPILIFHLFVVIPVFWLVKRYIDFVKQFKEPEEAKNSEGYLKKLKIYLFSWDKIPGSDNGRLEDFLIQDFGIDWIKTAEIKKIDDGRKIKVSGENNLLFLSLNNEKTKVNLIIDDGRTDELIAKTENGNLNIYLEKSIKEIARNLQKVKW